MRLLLTLAVFALAGTGIASGVATANNGATTTHFTASYTDSGFGPVVCAGERIVKTAPNVLIKDSEDCTILNGFPAGTYSCADLGMNWFSDYDGNFALGCTFVITDNGDGTSNNHIVVYYRTVSISYTPTSDPKYCGVTVNLSHFAPNTSFSVSLTARQGGQSGTYGPFTVNTDSTGAGSITPFSFQQVIPTTLEANVEVRVGAVSSGQQPVAC